MNDMELNEELNSLCSKLISAGKMQVIKKNGLLFAPTLSFNGYEFGEYDNGKCYSRYPWVHYYYIKKGTQVLRCRDYEVWLHRIFKLIEKN